MKLFLSSSHLIILAIISLPVMIASSCKKSDSAPPPTIPAVTTTALTNVTTSSATTGGTIVTDGNAKISQSGIVWSKTSSTPILADSVIAGSVSNGSFTINLTGLDFNTVYYIRAFATNTVGTGYGDVVKLNTTNDTTKVRFTYNGKEVVYGIITSPTTGKKWLDRDLGAKRVANSFDDYQAYGDLFQWGRPADGHQLINWTTSTAGTAGNGITTVVAISDIPGHSNFIASPNATPYDWRNDNNSNRWVTLPQGPCPIGWHVPTFNEWAAEISNTIRFGTATSGGMIDRNTAYSQLKLTVSGYRDGIGATAGQFGQTGNYGFYWSSADRITIDGYFAGRLVNFGSDFIQLSSYPKAYGYCVRCTINTP